MPDEYMVEGRLVVVKEVGRLRRQQRDTTTTDRVYDGARGV
jgi:hypothetical protein